MNVPELGVVGAGRVGAPLAISLAMSGTCVVAFDRDATLIDAWSSGNAAFREIGVETALAQSQATGMLRFTGERAQLAGVPILIIAVGTPSMASNADASLRAEGAEVRCSDEYARDPGFITKDELIAKSEIIIVAVPHAAYAELPIPGDRIVVDTCGGLAPR